MVRHGVVNGSRFTRVAHVRLKNRAREGSDSRAPVFCIYDLRRTIDKDRVQHEHAHSMGTGV